MVWCEGATYPVRRTARGQQCCGTFFPAFRSPALDMQQWVANNEGPFGEKGSADDLDWYGRVFDLHIWLLSLVRFCRAMTALIDAQ
jgi:hypothetical protein